MSRLLRLLTAVLAALFVGLGAAPIAPAFADGSALGGAPTSAPDDRSEARGQVLVAPHDVPVVASTARAAIPPVPASYVTKDLGWLELSYPPAAGERVASIVRDADGIKAELTRALGQPVLAKVTVRIAPTVADMARLAPSGSPPPDYASGVAYRGLELVLISMLAPRGADAVDLDEVFRHELVHVALEDAVQGAHVPVWFNEGLATTLSGERAVARMQTLWSATLSGTLIPLADIDRTFPRDNHEVSIAYAQSADFMRFLTRKSDSLRFSSLIERVREGQSFDRAIAEAYGSDLRRLELEWRSELEHRFSVIPVLTGGGLVWVLIVGGFVFAYARRRRRAKAILARWEREEALEDARIAARLAVERAERAEPSITVTPASAAATAPSVSVKVERDGRWHTLH